MEDEEDHKERLKQVYIMIKIVYKNSLKQTNIQNKTCMKHYKLNIKNYYII